MIKNMKKLWVGHKKGRRGTPLDLWSKMLCLRSKGNKSYHKKIKPNEWLEVKTWSKKAWTFYFIWYTEIMMKKQWNSNYSNRHNNKSNNNNSSISRTNMKSRSKRMMTKAQTTLKMKITIKTLSTFLKKCKSKFFHFKN